MSTPIRAARASCATTMPLRAFALCAGAIADVCAWAMAVKKKAMMRARTRIIFPSTAELPRPAVIGRVRPHVSRAGDAVRHVEEAGDRGNVPDVAIGESGAAQALAVVFLHAPRRGGEFHRKIEHGALALGQPRHAVVHHDLVAEQRIAGILPPRRAVRGE